ncbi:hypothetical protein T459_15845 [Capsicum annuum]|uniref:Uncharacterized protein n=1 Tax=Capsicum annuum TaxID=4072 RepID=A0A2G2Z719_CAPAN|nr:hypothetical protein FXO37_15582 [Capsicum annuum]PHT77793.1 hypothetical protein T459_15845 [Capsicum annuum]
MISGRDEIMCLHMLEEILTNLGDVDSLKLIELVKSPQLEDSALKIKQYVEEMTGWDALKNLSLPLSSPPSRHAAAMPCTLTFLPPNAGDFNGAEVIEKFQCNKKWDLCLQGVIIVMQAGGINHRYAFGINHR